MTPVTPVTHSETFYYGIHDGVYITFGHSGSERISMCPRSVSRFVSAVRFLVLGTKHPVRSRVRVFSEDAEYPSVSETGNIKF